MRRVCVILLLGVLMTVAGQALADDSCGCGSAAPDGCDNEGKIKHCARRLCAWLTYQPQRCKACKGLVTPVNYPPLYTFFPCTANLELPPYTWCKSDCASDGKCLFERDQCCDTCAHAPADAPPTTTAVNVPDALRAVPQAQLLPPEEENR